jgi:hypothetical protein
MDLGGLWDLPISIMDALPPSEKDEITCMICR